jgi:hypothetical protein
MLYKDYDRRCSIEKKYLNVGLKGLRAKTNWLAVNRQSYSNSDSDSDRTVTLHLTLRVIGGDEKGSLESETVKYGL